MVEPGKASPPAGCERGGDVAHDGRKPLLASALRLIFTEQAHLLVHLVKWAALGGIVGLVAGLSSAALLESLTRATEVREAHGWLLWLLPLAGLGVGLVYHHLGGDAAQGSNLIIDEIHEPKRWVPRRMAPLIYAATVATHLFGGSAGREGTAIQMSGSFTDAFARLARIGQRDRRLMLIDAIAGGFGAVFGVPLAGFVFALEVQAIGRIRHDAIVGALAASLVGDQVVRALGVHHTVVPIISAPTLTAVLVAKISLAGIAFGLTAVTFAELTHALKRLFARIFTWPPLRPLVGGLLIIALTYVVGSRDYLGLSLPLITASLSAAGGVAAGAFALKLVFTTITLSSGFHGGEVTPLFVIGATLGATLGDLLGIPVPLLAAVGFVAVFAAATNTPIACTIMGIELFTASAAVPFAIGCVCAYIVSSHRSIYPSQRIAVPKLDRVAAGDGDL